MKNVDRGDHDGNSQRPQVRKRPRPAWGTYTGSKRWPLWEAVALSCNIDPRSIQDPREEAYRRRTISLKTWRERLGEAQRAAGRRSFSSLGSEKDLDVKVAVASFVQWAADAWGAGNLPREFLEFGDAASDAPAERPTWPWGDHSTRMLEHVAATARHWYRTYTPGDHENAPTKEEVIAWLKRERGVQSDRDAVAIWKVVRADGVPDGPRRPSR